MPKFEFLTNNNQVPLFIESRNAVAAFLELKRRDQENYAKMKKFTSVDNMPSGYQWVYIGYGLYVCYQEI